MNTHKSLLLFILLSILPSAHAHLIGGAGLSSGLVHPLLGFDHLLAMLAVGVISAKIGGRAILVLPMVFASFMVIGGTLAIMGIALPGVEIAIALSVLFFGALIAFSKTLALKWAVVFAALFALFHGHAHGEEMPIIAEPVFYALGFVASTITLHLSGAVIAREAKKMVFTSNLLRFSGALASATGLLLLTGLILA